MNAGWAKLMAACLLLGLLAVAAALYFSAKPQLPSASSYKGYEPVRPHDGVSSQSRCRL
jgi:hypothetical protein